MKTGTLSKALGVSRDTVLRYANMPEFAPFLSDAATGKDNRPHRIYNKNDVLVINTIVYLLNTEKLRGWDKIVKRLEEGFRHREFSEYLIPEDRYSIPRPQAEQLALTTVTTKERDMALAQVNELKERVEALEAEKESIRDELTQQIIELNKRIGYLEGQLSIKNKPGFFDRFRGSSNE